jgi:hypothetical protein
MVHQEKVHPTLKLTKAVQVVGLATEVQLKMQRKRANFEPQLEIQVN